MSAERDKQCCAACGGDLFQFEPPPSVKLSDPAGLPTACQGCGQICVGGRPLAFPTGFQKRVANVADEAARQGKLAREHLLSDPAIRVEKYFDHVYRSGFVHGFIRALVWFTHQAKEGRLKRLRRLWQQTEKTSTATEALIRMPSHVFSEFTQLLEMEVRSEHAEGAADADAAG